MLAQCANIAEVQFLILFQIKIFQDKGSPSRSSTMTLTVNIQDVDNLDPAFDYTFYNGQVTQVSDKCFSPWNKLLIRKQSES